MNRQERRQRERSSKKYDKRQTFTKKEVEDLNAASYQHGLAFGLYAASRALNLGEVRLDRIRKEIQRLEATYFAIDTLEPLPFDVQDIIKYKGAAINATTTAGKGKRTRTR